MKINRVCKEIIKFTKKRWINFVKSSFQSYPLWILLYLCRYVNVNTQFVNVILPVRLNILFNIINRCTEEAFTGKLTNSGYNKFLQYNNVKNIFWLWGGGWHIFVKYIAQTLRSWITWKFTRSENGETPILYLVMLTSSFFYSILVSNIPTVTVDTALYPVFWLGGGG